MIKKTEEIKSDMPRNIYQRINAVMKEVRYVQKENKKVNNQYTFVSHDGVSAALHMPMAENGIVFVPTVEEIIQESFESKNSKNDTIVSNKTMIKMKLSFINADNPEDFFFVHYHGMAYDNSDKGIGKAISYAVKYALLKVFCLETGDDIEKDDIIPIKVGYNADQVKEQKNLLVNAVGGKHKGESVGKYFAVMSDTYKKTVDELVMTYVDVNKFINDFSEWELANVPQME